MAVPEADPLGVCNGQQTTIVVATLGVHERLTWLRTMVGHLRASPRVAEIVVLWQKPTHPAPRVDGARVVAMANASLTNRYRFRDYSLLTCSALVVDDDMDMRPAAVESMWAAWGAADPLPSLLGFVSRHTMKDGRYSMLELRMGDGRAPARYVLPPFLVARPLMTAFLSPHLWSAREFVDQNRDCDDLLLNEVARAARFVVTRIGYPANFDKIPRLSLSGLSSKRNQVQVRSSCAQHFARKLSFVRPSEEADRPRVWDHPSSWQSPGGAGG